MNKSIVVTLQLEGLHSWSNCPYKEVSFLREQHRHIFHIKAYKKVSHNDREIEIIMLKRSMQEYLLERWGEPSRNQGVRMPILKFGDMSCEMIAEKLLYTFSLDACEVLEDGENGAVIYTDTDGE